MTTKGDDSLSTQLEEVRPHTIIADARTYRKDFNHTSEGALKPCFKQMTMTFDSSSYSSVGTFLLETDSLLTDASLYVYEQNTYDNLEVRVDEFSLS